MRSTACAVEQLAKVRRQLEGMFRELQLIQDVIEVCGGVRESVSSDLDDEVEHVLRRCGSDRLFSVLKALTGNPTCPPVGRKP